MKKFVLIAMLLTACPEGEPTVGECHEITPVLVTDENGDLLDLNCECWTGQEWLGHVCP